ncbi:MAG: polyribonucleotide nucleotidyltransferase [bacterium]
MKITKVSLQVGGKTLTLEQGHFAEKTNAAILATYGETVVHVTTCMASGDTNLPYFPLSVDYAEKLYAGGKIKGSRWVKRDGRPSDDAVLKGRIIDRSIRPLFPKNVHRDVQVIATILSADGENDADMSALIATSAALHISDIPWNGPIAAVRMGMTDDGKYLVNPTYAERLTSKLDLVVSGSKDAIVMVEAGANEVTEEAILEAMKLAHTEIKKIVAVIEELQTKVGKEKLVFPEDPKVDPTLAKEIENSVKAELSSRLGNSNFDDGLVEDLTDALVDKYAETLTKGEISSVIEALFTKLSREMTINKEVRVDGRKTTEIRELTAEIDLLPHTHGSAMFKRGETQVLSIATLGAPALGQLLESMEGEETKHYIHHYSAPPYSYGEPGRFGYPGRREIGHGALAERALFPMIPAQVDFPYTIHVVSEVMSSNGSTSQASVCGSTMALMAAGVPLKKPVAGIAMGLMTDGKKSVVLTDIAGVEDHIGDMDFKVAGTKDGVTALQMDIKVSGISFDVLERALAQAKDARMAIMEIMLKCIAEPRKELNKYAPKIVQFEIPTDKIGEVIGPGGKMIKQIMSETGVEVDIDDSTGKGMVTVSGVDPNGMDKAVGWIKNMCRVPEVGEIFDGEVVRIQPFGAFVNILPGKDGLLHVSKMSKEFVKDPRDLVKEGQIIKVQIDRVDEMGKISLSLVQE